MQEPQIGIEPMTARQRGTAGAVASSDNYRNGNAFEGQEGAPFRAIRRESGNETATEFFEDSDSVDTLSSIQKCAVTGNARASRRELTLRREVTLWKRRCTIATKQAEEWKKRALSAEHDMYQAAYELADTRAKLTVCEKKVFGGLSA